MINLSESKSLAGTGLLYATLAFSQLGLTGCAHREEPLILDAKAVAASLETLEKKEFYLRGTIRIANEFWHEKTSSGTHQVYQAWYVTQDGADGELKVKYPAYLGPRNPDGAAPEIEAAKGVPEPFKGRVLVTLEDGNLIAIERYLQKQGAIRE